MLLPLMASLLLSLRPMLLLPAAIAETTRTAAATMHKTANIGSRNGNSST